MPLLVAAGYLVVFLGALIALRKTLLRRATYRRLAYFGLVLSGYTFASRLLGVYPLTVILGLYFPLTRPQTPRKVG